MPNWKKVIVSGSDAVLSNITASNISASGHISASNFIGDGSGLTNVTAASFPFTGDAVITGSLLISGSGGSSIFTVDGRSFFKDQVTFGNSTADSVSFTSRVSSNFLSTGLNDEKLGTQSEPWFGATITSITSSNISASGNLIGNNITASGDILIEGGGLEIKNDGAQSYARFYCEFNNQHYTEVKAQPHSLFSGNPVMLLPAYNFDFSKPFFGDSSTTVNITASGDISSSGNVIANDITASNAFHVQAFDQFEFTIADSQFNMVNQAADKNLFFLTSTGTGTINFGTNNVNSEVIIGTGGHITSSGAISSSDHLFFSASSNNNTGFKTLVIDTSTGQVYHTGSYQGGGGSGTSLTVTEQDGSPSVSNVNTIKFSNGTVTDNGSGVVSVSNSGGSGGTFPFVGDAVITGSLTISESGANTYDTLKVNNAFYGTEINSSTAANTLQYYFRIPTGSYNGAFFDYVATSGSGDFFTGRSGTVQSIWEIDSETPRVAYNDFSTRGIGGNTTNDLKFKVDVKNGNARLISKDTTGQYQIKVIARGI
tara:strand:+ start:7871 stop:9493 length:1623 start_codon:yes stop_codon:yes gene_type:complete